VIFQIIDHLYTGKTATELPYSAWDASFHSLSPAKAVCNRKSYFKQLLADMNKPGGLDVLNLASGPCRDVAEVLPVLQYPCRFTCIDQEPRAIDYARGLLPATSAIKLIRGNALRLNYKQEFDLAWSAGLLDYFEERGFRMILRGMYNAVRPGGRVVVGNFSENNPDRAFMEWGEWMLIHRSAAELIRLGRSVVGEAPRVWVEQEPEGVNLFLNILKPS